MKLRDLFDKLTPGMLDTEVDVIKRLQSYGPLKALGISHYELQAVEIQDDGSVTLVISE